MNYGNVFQFLPLWVTFSGTVVVVLLSIRCGLAMARYRRDRSREEEEEAPISTVAGATLGLLAFILAFTFGITASRFDTRKQLLLDEVNAIETTYLRTDLIPEPHRTAMRGLLREYVDLRVNLTRHPETVHQVVSLSEKLQQEMWRHAGALANEELKNPDIVSLFVDSLNEVIDLQTKRVTVGIVYRIPTPIWIALFGLTILSMIEVGYLFGKQKRANWPLALALSFAFSVVIALIADLDRTGAGASAMIRVDAKPILDLQERLRGPGD